MTNCSECGVELGEGAGVCEKCGATVAGESQTGGRKKAGRIRRPASPLLMRTPPLILYLSGSLIVVGLLILSLPLTKPFDDPTVNALYLVSGFGLIAVAIGMFVFDRIRRRRSNG